MKVLFYPERGDVKNGHSLCKQRVFCDYLGLEITDDPLDNYDFAVYLDLRDVNTPPKMLYALETYMPVVNLHCNNLDRRYVEKVFKRVFGYPSFAKPGEKCIRKGNYQGGGHHSIHTICPEEPDKYIYQRFIDSSIDENTIRVIRPVIFGRKVRALIIKESDKSNLFEQNARIKKEYFYNNTKDWIFYSDHEIKQIERFADILCLDYGELDVMRDKDNRIYVIDVNNIPGSQVFARLKNGKFALDTMAHEFAKLLKGQ